MSTKRDEFVGGVPKGELPTVDMESFFDQSLSMVSETPEENAKRIGVLPYMVITSEQFGRVVEDGVVLLEKEEDYYG